MNWNKECVKCDEDNKNISYLFSVYHNYAVLMLVVLVGGGGGGGG